MDRLTLLLLGALACACASAERQVAAPVLAKLSVEVNVSPRISFCPSMVEVIVRVHEGGPEYDCVAENFTWGDGDRSAHASCEPGDRALRVYSDKHLYRRSGAYAGVVQLTGIREGKATVLFWQEFQLDVRAGLAC